ncbi:hypothetical protein AAC387_Pa10g0704 [Persea americana]
MVEWNVVKGKPGSDRIVTIVKSQSPSKRSTQMLNVEPNRFLSLSNLDRDSSVGAAEFSATTALVLHQSDSAHGLSDTGQAFGQGVVSTQAPTSSRSAGAKSVHKQGSVQKQKQGLAGVIIKERALLKSGSK